MLEIKMTYRNGGLEKGSGWVEKFVMRVAEL
jgi:hypothetical protein